MQTNTGMKTSKRRRVPVASMVFAGMLFASGPSVHAQET